MEIGLVSDSLDADLRALLGAGTFKLDELELAVTPVEVSLAALVELLNDVFKIRSFTLRLENCCCGFCCCC